MASQINHEVALGLRAADQRIAFCRCIDRFRAVADLPCHQPGLIIYRIYMGYWFFGRPTMEDLREDLRVVTKKCRPDWDITTPELKAAWQQGRKELFYPYGKTYVQTLGEQD